MTHVIFHFNVRDRAALADYSDAALSVLRRHGGTPVAIGPADILHQGTLAAYASAAVFSFPDRNAAERWFADTDYQVLSPLRARAMDCTIYLVG